MVSIRQVVASDHEAIIDLLRTDFFPHEPAAIAINLCPRGNHWNSYDSKCLKWWQS